MTKSGAAGSNSRTYLLILLLLISFSGMASANETLTKLYREIKQF
jgi:hypothetical protein